MVQLDRAGIGNLVDIYDSGNSMRVLVDLAGMNKDAMTVDVQDSGNRIMISGEYRMV